MVTNDAGCVGLCVAVSACPECAGLGGGDGGDGPEPEDSQWLSRPRHPPRCNQVQSTHWRSFVTIVTMHCNISVEQNENGSLTMYACYNPRNGEFLDVQ